MIIINIIIIKAEVIYLFIHSVTHFYVFALLLICLSFYSFIHSFTPIFFTHSPIFSHFFFTQH